MTTAAPEVTEAPAEEPAPEEITESAALYTYTQQGGDFNSESVVQYQFDLNDYTDELVGTADIEVKVAASKNVAGALGFGTVDGEWIPFENSTAGGSESVWEAENIDLSELNGNAAVQFYYIKDGAEVSVEEVSVSIADDELAEIVNSESDDNEQTEAPDDDEQPTADDTDGDADADDTTEGTQDDEEADADDDTAEAYDDDDELLDDEGETLENSGDVTAKAIENQVAAAANEAMANPQTGDVGSTTNVIRFILIMLSSCVLVYSGVAITLNKLVFEGRKKK